MSSPRNILRLAIISLVCVFIVIIAGSVVRITGSGMGCPDWPFCFGYAIPPTDVGPLTFTPDHTFKEGQMIIANDTLWVANHDFVTAQKFSHTDWHKYPKHNYAIFNATHTWIEYINRLATGVLGFPCMILLLISFIRFIRTKEWVTLTLALFTVFGLGFEAWLGKLVVDGNLKENSITYHMLGTMVIIGLLIAIIRRHATRPARRDAVSRVFIVASVLMLVLSIVQVVLGTQVREEIDVIAKNIDHRGSWIAQLSSMFIVHRSFAYLVVACSLFLFYLSRKHQMKLSAVMWMQVVMVLEVAAGFVLSHFDMPRLMQPAHLLLGMVMFALALQLVLLAVPRSSIAQPTK